MRGTMILPGETAAGSAEMQPCRGIAWLGSSRRSLHLREYRSRAPANPHRIGRAACLENHRPKDGVLHYRGPSPVDAEAAHLQLAQTLAHSSGGREEGKDCLMEEGSTVRKIAFVGDYSPRKCGIATFTSDLLAAVAAAHPQSQCFSVSVNDIKGGYEYPEVVRFEIEEKDLSSYLSAADFLNISDVDIVCLQHEFGIFGGTAGGHILALLRELRMPVVTTLHTILREPKAEQRRVMHELAALSTRLVVMTERGRQMLQQIYQAPP